MLLRLCSKCSAPRSGFPFWPLINLQEYHKLLSSFGSQILGFWCLNLVNQTFWKYKLFNLIVRGSFSASRMIALWRVGRTTEQIKVLCCVRKSFHLMQKDVMMTKADMTFFLAEKNHYLPYYCWYAACLTCLGERLDCCLLWHKVSTWSNFQQG